MRLHGIDRDVWDRFTSDKPSWEYDVVAPGYKYNLPDALAAIGLAQLERAAALRDARQAIALYYMRELAGVPGLDLPRLRPGVDAQAHAWHLFAPVLSDPDRLSRNDAMARLAERGVGTSVHYKPLHRMTYYRERYQLRPESFPDTERIWRGTFSLPLYPGLTADEQARVVAAVKEVLR
jgi:dTDP-4-amino-4,6-dideoxygalactose transaminase